MQAALPRCYRRLPPIMKPRHNLARHTFSGMGIATVQGVMMRPSIILAIIISTFTYL